MISDSTAIKPYLNTLRAVAFLEAEVVVERVFFRFLVNFLLSLIVITA